MTPAEAEALVNQGASIDAEAGAEMAAASQVAPPPAVAVIDPAQDWLFVPELLSMVICVALPEVAAAYTDEANLRLAEKLAVVAEKRGWNGASSPEISLAIAAVGFGMPAFMAYKQRQMMALEQQNTGRTLNGKPVINGGEDGDRQ